MLEYNSLWLPMLTHLFFPRTKTRSRTQCARPATRSRTCTRSLDGTWVLEIPVSECSTILKRYSATSARATNVNVIQTSIVWPEHGHRQGHGYGYG